MRQKCSTITTSDGRSFFRYTPSNAERPIVTDIRSVISHVTHIEHPMTAGVVLQQIRNGITEAKAVGSRGGSGLSSAEPNFINPRSIGRCLYLYEYVDDEFEMDIFSIHETESGDHEFRIMFDGTPNRKLVEVVVASLIHADCLKDQEVMSIMLASPPRPGGNDVEVYVIEKNHAYMTNIADLMSDCDESTIRFSRVRRDSDYVIRFEPIMK